MRITPPLFVSSSSILFVCTLVSPNEAFLLPQPQQVAFSLATRTDTQLNESKIPKELRGDIYRAESNTPAAQGRKQRTIGYGAGAFIFLVLGLGNVVLTSMNQVGVDLYESGYGWTQSIPLLSNTFGGYFDIVAAGLFGTMVELENRTREETAEKIWEELERRKEALKSSRGKKKVNRSPIASTSKGGKKSSSKKKKRMAAFAEVIVEEDAADISPPATTTTNDDDLTKGVEVKKGGGIMEKLNNFYKEADSMAASQALLLNKKLEDEGILDKVTDETGLRVIGKDAASKINKETSNEKDDA